MGQRTVLEHLKVSLPGSEFDRRCWREPVQSRTERILMLATAGQGKQWHTHCPAASNFQVVQFKKQLKRFLRYRIDVVNIEPVSSILNGNRCVGRAQL